MKNALILLIMLLLITHIFQHNIKAQENAEDTNQYEGYVRTAYIIEGTSRYQTWLARPEGYEGTFLLSNQQPAMDYLLTCLLNYRQVACRWDGNSTILYPVSLDGGEEVRIPMITPPLQRNEFQDFIVLAFANPFSEDLSQGYRIRTDLNYLYNIRGLFLPENFDEATMPYNNPISDELWIRGNSENPILEGIIQNLIPSSEELRAWTVEEATAGQELEYYLHIGAHPSGEGSKLAIMVFLNYEQISFGGEDNWVLYANLEAGTSASVPVRLQVPDEAGIYELMIVYTYNPYSNLETPPLGTVRRATEIAIGSYSTIRTAIVVR